jgi:hypothetical protein
VSKKTWSLKFNDKKMYNTKWIARLGQVARGNLEVSKVLENFERMKGNGKEN